MGTYTNPPDGLTSQSDDKVDVKQVDRLGAPAPATRQSFAHLDEKAILRKVRSRPISATVSIVSQR
jgi:hypothetical protein